MSFVYHTTHQCLSAVVYAKAYNSSVLPYLTNELFPLCCLHAGCRGRVLLAVCRVATRTPLIRTPASRRQAALPTSVATQAKRAAPPNLRERLENVDALYSTADAATASPFMQGDDASGGDEESVDYSASANENDEPENDEDQLQEPEISSIGTGRKSDGPASPTLRNPPRLRRCSGNGVAGVSRRSRRRATASKRPKNRLFRNTGSTRNQYKAPQVCA